MTNNQQPTIIFANEEQKRLWLGALRGEIPNPKTGKPFEQCKGALEEKGKYCCLGVVQVMLSGEVDKYGENGCSEILPDMGWFGEQGIELITTKLVPPVTRDPWLTSLNTTCSGANDELEKSFAQIADAIEACSVVRSSE